MTLAAVKPVQVIFMTALSALIALHASCVNLDILLMIVVTVKPV